MDDLVYNLVVTSAAYLDLERQHLWLLENRGRSVANQLDDAVSNCFRGLEAMPERWQRLDFPRSHIRKAVVLRRYLLFYTINKHTKTVLVLAFRGAAEDWTNQPLPTD